MGPAQTRAVERLGNISYGYFETGQGHQLVAQIIGNTDLKSGDPVVLSSRFADMHLFAADGRTIMRRELTTPVELN